MAKTKAEIDFSGWVVEYNPTREERLQRLKRELKRNAKMMKPQYRHAVEKNKRMEAYNNMLLKVKAEISPTKQKEILNKWCSGFGYDK
tara:strand:- start:73 stop:336 length:264 start_codon:yes stop_codon:yes gene_type:complete